MAFPKFTFSKYQLRNLNTVVITLHVIVLFISSGLIVAAVRIKQAVGDYINMILSNEGHLLPAVLAVLALICIPVNSFGLYCIIKSRTHIYQLRLNAFLFWYVIATGIISISIISIIVLCYIHAQHIQESMHNGILDAMKKYGNDISTKIEVDMLQIKFQCCGSKSYKEWFMIPWFDPNLGGISPTGDGDFVSDDVPFSCCSRTALRPCIHHGIMSSSSVYRYDPQRQFSVSTIGCQKALVTATKNLLKANIAVLLLLTALQITVSFGSRLLQTAYSSSDTGLGTHMSWIFGTNSHLKRSSQIQSELQDNATDDEEFSSKVPTVKEQETEN